MEAMRDEQTVGRAPWAPVLLVLLLAIGVRTWVVARSEVAARDSIGFIKTALRFEQEPFVNVLRTSEQPPAYPFTVLVASWPIRAWNGGVTPDGMALAAQLASATFGVLLVLPMIGFGAELVDRRFGCAAAGFFQCLPAWVRFTSDGLSEALFLFLVAMSLWLASRALRLNCWITMAACGLAAGLAYLTRPEGAEVAGAVAVVLFALGWLRRIEPRRFGTSMAALAIGFSVCCGLFFAATGRLTNKPTGRFMMGEKDAEKSFFGEAKQPPVLLASWWNNAGDPDRSRALWAARTLLIETANSARQVGLLLAIVGLCFWSRGIRNGPGGAVLIVLSALHACVLVWMTSRVGYLSERHTAMIVFAGCYPATLAVVQIAERLGGQRKNLRWEKMAVPLCVMTAFLTACPSLLKSMHGNRAGHKAAGEWLAAHAPASAGIRDPFCWGRYYAGRDFRESAAADPDEQFVIVEMSNSQHSRLPLIPEVKAKAAAGQLVYHWPESKSPGQAQVSIYRWLRPESNPIANRPFPPADGGE